MLWPSRLAPVIISVALLAGMACTTSEHMPELSIHDAWARPAAVSGSTVVYFTLTNRGNTPDVLSGVSSNIADMSGIHETKTENDLLRMVSVSSLEVPAGGRIEMKPGGFHVMLMGLKQALNPGDMVSLTLYFEKTGQINMKAEVRQP